MAETLQRDPVEIENIVRFFEQHIAAGSQFDGAAPALGATVFVPYADNYDQILRYGSPTVPATKEGDRGGLFIFETAGPASLEYILANFGSPGVTWTLSVVTRDGHTAVVATSTGQYILRIEYDKFHLARGDTLKLVTSGATLAMWVRIGLTLAQGS